MTNKQRADAFAGKTADLLLENGLRFGVRTIKGQARYGRIDVLVEPLEGSGQAWVGAGKVKLRKEAQTPCWGACLTQIISDGLEEGVPIQLIVARFRDALRDNNLPKLESEWDKPSLVTPFHAYVESSGYVGHGFCGICGCAESYSKHAPQPAEEQLTPSTVDVEALDSEEDP